MSDQETDAAVGAHIRQMVAEGDRDELQLMLFHEHVSAVPGRVGELLRQVAYAHGEFVAAADRGDTTASEETRLLCVVDLAVALVEYLRDGGQL
jgi:hypothetical protein